MSEHTVIEVLFCHPLATINDYPFAVVALVLKYVGILFDVAFPAASAPSRSQSKSHPFGQDGKESLVQPTAENTP